MFANQIFLFRITALCAALMMRCQNAESQHAYFLLNADCSDVQSCVGETHDISVVCLNSKCICDPRLGVYDLFHYQCVGKADHACLGDLCTKNSVCDSVTNTCKCLSGYDLSPDGNCVHKHGESCEEDEDCKREYLCYDGLCECRYPNHQYYHAENDTCYSIAQSWDSNIKSNSARQSFSTGNSPVFQTFEIFLLLVQVGALVGIAIILGKLVKTIAHGIGGLKLHGYFLRTGQLKHSDLHIADWKWHTA